ncbi:MAG: YtxH domain-containing protein [Dehalococcoidia bacterium]|nr:YtxH domain-containing protein [Dehalococcoidia bacterium]
MNKDHANGFGIGLFTGAVIGGVIALLYAPKPIKLLLPILAVIQGIRGGGFKGISKIFKKESN